MAKEIHNVFVGEPASPEQVERNVRRWRSLNGKPLAHVNNYVRTKRNPNEHKFGNIGFGLMVEGSPIK